MFFLRIYLTTFPTLMRFHSFLNFIFDLIIHPFLIYEHSLPPQFSRKSIVTDAALQIQVYIGQHSQCVSSAASQSEVLMISAAVIVKGPCFVPGLQSIFTKV